MSTQLHMIRPDLNELPAVPELTNGYSVRHATQSDDVQLARVLTAAFGPEMLWSAQRVREELTGNGQVQGVYVVVHNLQVVATTSIQVQTEDRDVATVHWVGTDPAHGGKGLGYALVVHVLHEMARLNFEASRLSTDDPRLAAIRTYFKCGFVPVFGVQCEDHRFRWSRVIQNLFGSRQIRSGE